MRKRAIKMLLSNKADNCTGTVNVQGDASGGSKLIVQTLQLKVVDSCQGFCKVPL